MKYTLIVAALVASTSSLRLTKTGVDPTDTNNQAITEEEDAKKAGCPGLSADCTSNVMPIPTKKFLKPLFMDG